MKILVGADPFGVSLKDAVAEHLRTAGHDVVEVGGRSGEDRSYYDVATEVARRVSAGEAARAVLVCGTGMGMAIVANKVRGVYAAVCETPATAERARSINNANVLTLGGMVTAPFQANAIVDTFLSTEFKKGWDEQIQDFLDQSMVDIGEIEADAFADDSD